MPALLKRIRQVFNELPEHRRKGITYPLPDALMSAVAIMMLTFLIDQVQEACCHYFQEARNEFRTRTGLRERIRAHFKLPRSGVQKLFVCLVAGQLLCSALVDHFGLFGVAEARVSLSRGVGIALVFIGIFMTYSKVLD